MLHRARPRAPARPRVRAAGLAGLLGLRPRGPRRRRADDAVRRPRAVRRRRRAARCWCRGLTALLLLRQPRARAGHVASACLTACSIGIAAPSATAAAKPSSPSAARSVLSTCAANARLVGLADRARLASQLVGGAPHLRAGARVLRQRRGGLQARGDRVVVAELVGDRPAPRAAASRERSRSYGSSMRASERIGRAQVRGVVRAVGELDALLDQRDRLLGLPGAVVGEPEVLQPSG